MYILKSRSIELYSVVLQKTYKAKCQSEVNFNQPCKGIGCRTIPNGMIRPETYKRRLCKMAYHAKAGVEKGRFLEPSYTFHFMGFMLAKRDFKRTSVRYIRRLFM